MTDTVLGLTFVTIAGVANATFALPMKFTRRWAWENIWLVWTLFALVLLPVVVAFTSIPSLGSVYRDAGTGSIVVVMLCGAGWGFAQVLFGLSIDAIGIGLTFSIVLGVCAAVGSLVPLLRLPHSQRLLAALVPIYVGIALVVAGVSACAIAGRMREKAESGGNKRSKPFGVGLVMAFCSGLFAASMNLGVAFGEPLIHSAAAHGASAQNVVNAIWLPLLEAGAIPNISFCVYLLSRRRSWTNFSIRETPVYLGLGFVMAILWFLSTSLYGIATTRLGDLGVIVGWPVYMSLIVVAAGVVGLVTGEWRHSGVTPKVFQIAGMFLLVLAAITLARAQYHSTVTANPDRAYISKVVGRNSRRGISPSDRLNVR